MSLWQRYLNLFEGEATWLIVCVSVLMVAGLIVIGEKLLRLSAWVVAFGFVAAGFLCAIYFIFFW